MRTIAFYLPQFHETLENNKWWGEGFTEWTNVKKAKPLFEGHYQPRVPLNNNYYNLLDDDVKKWQIDIAKKYGIYGFCIYHYWFNGKLLLEKPIEQYLNNKDLNFPFCLCWANEEWTNGWISSKTEVLMRQDYTDKSDWEKHFQYFLPFFLDSRYIYEDGNPLLVIYYPSIIDNLEEMIKYWKKRACENGLSGLTILYQKAQYHFETNLKKEIFDGGIEFQPGYTNLKQKSNLTRQFETIVFNVLSWLKKNLNLYLRLKEPRSVWTLDYSNTWDKIISNKPDNKNMYPGAFVDWDNTPRKGIRGSVYTGASPEKFEKYFSNLIKQAKNIYKKDTIFIFAWNEWGEGGYLEPDEKYKYGYLEAIRDSLINEDEFPNWP